MWELRVRTPHGKYYNMGLSSIVENQHYSGLLGFYSFISMNEFCST